jgi:DNA repair photolyase
MPDATQRLRWATVEEEQAFVLPGLGERITHPEFQGVEFLHVRAKTILNHVPAAAGLPFEWTINVYRGCTHACTYCFARPSHTYLDLDAGQDFASVIVVKVNAVERLRAELRSPRWQAAHVALGTNTDPYQRCEGRYRLTRGVVQTLAEAGNSFSLLTKGTLVTRDLDVLAAAAQRGVCTGVSLSVPTLDEDVWRASEPGTPHPRARMEAVAAIGEAGIPAGVMIAPIMPGISDDPAQLAQVVKAAIEAGATSITPIVLHLRPGVREVFDPWLRDVRPDLVERYRQLYQRSHAPKAERRRIGGIVRDLIRTHGGLPRPPQRADGERRGRAARATAPSQSLRDVQPAESEQLTLL